MADIYNITNVQNANNLQGFLLEVNIISNGMFGTLILLSVFAILFLGFKGFESKRAIMGASFITSIVSIFLRLMGLIGDTPMFTTFIITAMAYVFIRFSDWINKQVFIYCFVLYMKKSWLFRGVFIYTLFQRL